jgi:hypothetical protein
VTPSEASSACTDLYAPLESRAPGHTSRSIGESDIYRFWIAAGGFDTTVEVGYGRNEILLAVHGGCLDGSSDCSEGVQRIVPAAE